VFPQVTQDCRGWVGSSCWAKAGSGQGRAKAFWHFYKSRFFEILTISGVLKTGKNIALGIVNSTLF
jgi:hypothetical protein